MIEKEDWEEPDCPLARSKAVPEPPEEGVPPSIREAIEEFDRLIARDEKTAAGSCLETWLSEFEKLGDWAAQITILNEMMGFYRNTGEGEKGLESVRRGVTLMAEHRLEHTVTGGTTFVNAATTLKAFGRAGEAMPYYEQAARAYAQNLDSGDYRFGGLFNNMALACADLAEYARAERYYQKAMAILERLKPGSIPELAVTWVNLACLYEKWGMEDQIDKCLGRAVEYFHSPEAVHDSYYAFNCRKCYGTFGYFGYFRMKKELEDEADRIYSEARRESE